MRSTHEGYVYKNNYVVVNSDMTYLLITIKYTSYLSSKQNDNFYY